MVTDARRRAREGDTIADLAAELEVPYNTLYAAVRGTTWTALTEPPVGPAEPAASAPRRSVLTARKVAAARRAFGRGTATLAELARRYGVSETTISAAVHGRSWQHVSAPPVPPGEPGISSMIAAREPEIRRRAEAGEGIRTIAADLGVAASTVSRLLTRAQHRRPSPPSPPSP
ncbi:helix-turn-helix domain-containing protein [Actinomadura sp. NPDC048394]|uniref:helix-turn-helix domain-containing protein n=1 Tax=Actinomadura sp. NPDC048394 TaxID=3158223 RepID=UPI0033C3DBBA